MWFDVSERYFMTVLWTHMRQIRLKSTGVNWARKCHRTVAGNNLSLPLYQLSVEDCFGVKSWGKLLQLLLKRCRVCDGTDPVGNPTHRRLAAVLVWCLTGLPSDSSSTAPDPLSVFIIPLTVVVKTTIVSGKYWDTHFVRF